MEKIHKNIGGIMPRKAIFICKECGNKFELEVYGEEEASERDLRLMPPECPLCHSIDLERIR